MIALILNCTMIFSNNAIFIMVLICDGNADDTDGADFHRFFFNNLKIHLRESASSASSAFPSHPVPNKNPSVPIKILRGMQRFQIKNCVFIIGWQSFDHQDTQTVTSCDQPLFLPFVPIARTCKVIWLPGFKSVITVELLVL